MLTSMGTGCRNCFHGCIECDRAAELETYIEDRVEEEFSAREVTRPGVETTAEVVTYWTREWEARAQDGEVSR